MATIRIPLHFYVDHRERDLPTPENLSRSKSYAVVRSDDPHLPELLADAEFYAAKWNTDFWESCPGIKRSAIATVRAINLGLNRPYRGG